MNDYLYNGIALPKPPAWDDFTYPFAAINYIIGNGGSYSAEFVYSNEPFVYHKATGYCTPPLSATVYRCTMDVYRSGLSGESDTDWSKPFTFPGLNSEVPGYYYVWTNTDIFSDDSSLYLKATEPTPLAKEKRVRQAWYSTTDQEPQKCPALPKWDKEAYPYAFMASLENDGFNTYFLYLSDKPFYCNTAELSIQTSSAASVLCCKYVSHFDVGIWDATVPVYGDIYLKAPTGYVWTNTDILHVPSGKDAFRTYDPILLGHLDLKSWLYGFVLGLTEMPLPLKIGEKPTEPIAYSYNGVILPKLPEWDREAYPYAVIIPKNDTYYLLLQDTKFNAVHDWFITTLFVDFKFEYDGTIWTDYTGSLGTATPIWSNEDIYQDDMLRLAASEPIPVYE